MFISFKLEQMIYFVLTETKEEITERKTRERERERERERDDNYLYPVLHLSLLLSFILQSEVIKEDNVRLHYTIDAFF